VARPAVRNARRGFSMTVFMNQTVFDYCKGRP
jgi:hypothetical protein